MGFLKLLFYKMAIVVSLSSNSDESDEYHEESNNSSSSGSDSSASGSSDEHYLYRVLGVPLQVFQEELRLKTALSSLAGLSFHIPASISSLDEKEDILYCCIVGIPFKIYEKKLGSIRS